MARWLVLFAAGCGKDVCGRLADVQSDRPGRWSEWADSCRQQLKACTDDDDDKLDAWFECTDEVGAFAYNPSGVVRQRGVECEVEHLVGLSDTCSVTFLIGEE